MRVWVLVPIDDCMLLLSEDPDAAVSNPAVDLPPLFRLDGAVPGAAYVPAEDETPTTLLLSTICVAAVLSTVNACIQINVNYLHCTQQSILHHI